jgi:hypothetical protein
MLSSCFAEANIAELAHQYDQRQGSSNHVRADDGPIDFHHAIDRPQQKPAGQSDQHLERQVVGRPGRPGFFDLWQVRQGSKHCGEAADPAEQIHGD